MEIATQAASASKVQPFTILMGEVEPLLADLVAWLTAEVIGWPQKEVLLIAARHADQVLRLARARRFDLHVVSLNNVLHRNTHSGRYVCAPEKSLELVARLKEHSPSPVVVLTGYWRDGLDRRASNAGADMILQLPFGAEDLQSQLAEQLRR